MAKKLQDIRVVFCDVDGTLTDGRLYLLPDGTEMKVFHVRDGVAVKMLRRIDVSVILVSGRSSAALENRATELDVSVSMGPGNKGRSCAKFMAELGYTPSEAMFVGDDLNDLSGFAACGVSVAVCDADDHVASQADIVLNARGGEGALSEVARRIFKARRIEWRDYAE